MEAEHLIGQPIETSLPTHLYMYEVPGQDDITELTFRRYLKDKEKWDEKIEEQAKDFPIDYRQKIKDAIKPDKIDLIKAGLQQPGIEIQKICMESIGSVATADRTELYTHAYELIKKTLEMGNIIPDYLKLIPELPTDKQESVQNQLYIRVKSELEKNNPDIPLSYIRAITYLPGPKCAELLMLGLNRRNTHIQEACADNIFSAPAEVRPELQNKVYTLVKEGLHDPDFSVQIMYGKMIKQAPEAKWPELYTSLFELIQNGLTSQNKETQKIYTGMIWLVPRQGGMRKKLDDIAFTLITAGLTSKDRRTQKFYAEMIPDVSTYEHALKMAVYELIKAGLATGNFEIQKFYANLISFTPQDQQPELKRRVYRLAKQGGEYEELKNLIIESPLYKNSGLSKDRTGREKFIKTGSETTLIGGNLKDKAIVRHIYADTFLAWQKAYEDPNIWIEAGFDYIPIEPIISYKLNAQGLVDVYSGVLDLNFFSWQKMTTDFTSELESDIERIKKNFGHIRN